MNMNMSMKLTSSLRALLLATVAAGALLQAVPARAEDDDDEALDNKILRNVLEGIGLRERERNIDYSERSPLVVPPNISALPAPAAGAQASVPPNWPVDQDVKRAKEAKAAEKKSRYRRADSASAEEDRPLSPDKLTPGTGSRRPSAESDMRNGDPYNRQTAETAARPEKPSALGYVGNIFSDAFGKKGPETAVFRGEPARESLTEPPPGYQTPSPSQPYGLTGVAPLPTAQGKAFEVAR
jgi:hypothetical protein